jgi:hypothetical protein
MDTSISGYISAAEDIPDLIQRLFLAKRAELKEVELGNNFIQGTETGTGIIGHVSLEHISCRLKGPASEVRSFSSSSASRKTTRSSVSLAALFLSLSH